MKKEHVFVYKRTVYTKNLVKLDKRETKKQFIYEKIEIQRRKIMSKILIGNIKGPRGEQGPQGIQGIPGPAGADGKVDSHSIIEFEDYERELSPPLPGLEESLTKIQSNNSIGKLISYIKAFNMNVSSFLKEAVTMNKLANNLDTTESGFALDARQGSIIKAKNAELENAIGEINNNSNLTEAVIPITVENNHYTLTTQYYPVYKNGFLVGSFLIQCKEPTDTYTIIGKLPSGYRLHGATYYFTFDNEMGSSGRRAFLYANYDTIGIRSGEERTNYVGAICLPCIKS